MNKSSKKFLGGYVSPELHDAFETWAHEKGLTKNALLEQLLTEWNEVDPDDIWEEGKPQLLDRYFDTELAQEINAIFVTAADTAQPPEELDPVFFWEQVSILLEHSARAPYEDRDITLDYRILVPPAIQTSIQEWLSQAMISADERTELMMDLAQAAQTEADAAAARARQVTLQFAADEWEQVQRLLSKQNYGLPLTTYLRARLGEAMEQQGDGFLMVADEAMYEVGKRLQDL